MYKFSFKQDVRLGETKKRLTKGAAAF